MLIKHVSDSMYESMHCFRIDAGSSSYPEAEFLIANVMVLTSLAFISGIVIHLSILSMPSRYSEPGMCISKWPPFGLLIAHT